MIIHEKTILAPNASSMRRALRYYHIPKQLPHLPKICCIYYLLLIVTIFFEIKTIDDICFNQYLKNKFIT
ncbi:hypothetical protein NIES37_10390 [Tolypothrix tenuis PCC 7101]|uniref:Uncharacterized protein n=1 Tax=Tolypothrix tenuis PCC 7101 TaxID=231146 RepID=A0A1Z4MUE4_9CYAN|nr:hypothetical protein NIES37_10390 [Tolypothrix tenuis PCC 7101]BAZ72390.1 hypothetical protein NIES50_09440 [Aulosira laxa NIES-50]